MKSVSNLWDIYYEKCKFNLGENLFWTHQDGYWVGCCRAHIEWMIKNDNVLFERCSVECGHEQKKKHRACCLNLVYGLTDYCFLCTVNLSLVLVQTLHTFRFSESGHVSLKADHSPFSSNCEEC